MEPTKRESEKVFIYNQMLFESQLGLLFARTYGDFSDEFERRMKEKLGECTEEDIQWVFEALERFEKRNAPKEKATRKAKSAQKPKKEE